MLPLLLARGGDTVPAGALQGRAGVLLLGFRGRYQDPVAPERDQLISTLNGLVAPFGVLPETAVLNVPLSTRQHPLLHSPFFWLVTLTLLLAGVWWGLHHWLNVLVDELLPQSLR